MSVYLSLHTSSTYTKPTSHLGQSQSRDAFHSISTCSELRRSKRDDTQQKVNLIEERLKAIEGNNSIKGMDAIELTLFPDVIIPHNFMMPDFVKYNGSSCPRAHMMMFC